MQYQKDGETRGDFVRLIDWANPKKNEWLAVNQFSIKGPLYKSHLQSTADFPMIQTNV
ncbi:MAG: type I restriction endonuclease [Dechloromonas sp.]|nr:type I restriction endonuclease [Dechloromonas sp.]